MKSLALVMASQLCSNIVWSGEKISSDNKNKKIDDENSILINLDSRSVPFSSGRLKLLILEINSLSLVSALETSELNFSVIRDSKSLLRALLSEEDTSSP